MQILDLSYCENISERELVLGSAGVSVEGQAVGTIEAYVFTDTFARRLRSGGAIAIGRGVAFASGGNPTASIEVAGEGDLVIEVNGSRFLMSKKAAIAYGIVVAIDLPDKKSKN
ncbi:MAG: hypothetical protein IGS39_12240 [Calothrix sp. C42_A2020_038]|nr:hypothetical protein [Calothrix sp. C42_A2020_038]